jgi:N-hydroxyarylamine O-acetyltransferase
MDRDRSLERIGLEPDAVADPDRETLERLQRAHVKAVPWDRLATAGDPFGNRDGEGVSLSNPDLYGTIVERERGGFCDEFNGLFGWLLDDLGFEVSRAAAMVLSDDGHPGPPASHLVNLVTLDRRYLVDLGMGVLKIRRPLPLDGTSRTDESGVAWRTAESERPDVDYLAQYREPGRSDWSDRYVFDVTPRELDYFATTCDYLQTAHESSFTGSKTVSIATDDGHLKVTAETMTEFVQGERREWPVTESEWYDALERVFGIRYRTD